MNDKCEKYESLFVFADEETLLEHIKDCPDCQKVHESMQSISSLVQEVKPYFKKEKLKNRVIKTICASFLFVVSLGSLMFYSLPNISSESLTATSYFEEYDSFISNDFGFPVDEYGLLMVD